MYSWTQQELKNCIVSSYHQHVKTFTHRLASSVLQKSLYVISNRSTAIWKPCFLSDCTNVCFQLLGLTWWAQIHLHHFVISFACTLCTVNNFRFTGGVVMENGGECTAKCAGETQTDTAMNRNHTRMQWLRRWSSGEPPSPPARRQTTNITFTQGFWDDRRVWSPNGVLTVSSEHQWVKKDPLIRSLCEGTEAVVVIFNLKQDHSDSSSN